MVDSGGRLLPCHVTGTAAWDIPNGMQGRGQGTQDAAMRALREQAGIGFAGGRFPDPGRCDYRRDRRQHRYRVGAGNEPGDLSHLACGSIFAHRVAGKPTPEMDGFRWAAREQVGPPCWPRMGALLLALSR